MTLFASKAIRVSGIVVDDCINLPSCIPKTQQQHQQQHNGKQTTSSSSLHSPSSSFAISCQRNNQVGTVMLYDVPIVSLIIENQERLCLAQISSTLLKTFSYNEIHNRRVALGITCVQCTPVQLEILRRAGAMPVSSRRCGMITRREAERLCRSFLGDNMPPRLPEDFVFNVHHECGWGCKGLFLPSRYNSSRAKCIKCAFCSLFFSPNKFIFHSHRTSLNSKYVQPDAANFNSWRRHIRLRGSPSENIVHAWEDVKAMFNGGTRKRITSRAAAAAAAATASVAVTTPALDASAVNHTASFNYADSLQTVGKCAEFAATAGMNDAATYAANNGIFNCCKDGALNLPSVPITNSTAVAESMSALPLTVVDYMWKHNMAAAASLKPNGNLFPWLHSPTFKFGFNLPGDFTLQQCNSISSSGRYYCSAFQPVHREPYSLKDIDGSSNEISRSSSDDEDETIDIETCNEIDLKTTTPVIPTCLSTSGSSNHFSSS